MRLGFAIPEFLGHFLGCRVGQKTAIAGLYCGEIFQFIGTALQGQELNVEVVRGVRLSQWGLLHRHHERHEEAIEIVILLADDADDERKAGQFVFGEVKQGVRVTALVD